MIDYRRVLAFLVYSLPVLVVGFGVSMGGYALAQLTGDAGGAALFWRVAMAGLMLLVADIILLVGLLGFLALNQTKSDLSEGEGFEEHDALGTKQ